MNTTTTPNETETLELALSGIPTPALLRSYLARARKADAEGRTETAALYRVWAGEVATAILGE